MQGSGQLHPHRQWSQEMCIRDSPDCLEVVLTGRNPGEELLKLADYVTEMKKIKHPFDQGIPARKGIEL